MAIAFVAGATAGSVGAIDDTTTGQIDTTGANLLVVVGTYYGLAGTPVSTDINDSKANTWSVGTEYETVGANSGIRIWYSVPTSVGSGHTFTFDADVARAQYVSITVAAFSGAAASPFDQQNGNNGGGAATIQPGSVTPSENNCVVITGVVTGGSATIDSINGGFTISNTTQYSNGVHLGGSLAYLIQTTAAAANPTWTLSASADCAAAIMSFKGPGGGGGATATSRRGVLGLLGVGR